MAEVEMIDHTADVGVRVRATDAEEAFRVAAEAMFDVMLNRERVREVEQRKLEVAGGGWEDLLIRWLEELLYLYESEHFVPRSFHLSRLTSKGLAAQIRGEDLDPARHEVGVQVKAVTYHQLRALPIPNGFEAQVIFDI